MGRLSALFRWLVLADDVTVRLFIDCLRNQLGSLLSDGSGRFAGIRTAFTATITHLLATESFTSFDALDHADDH